MVPVHCSSPAATANTSNHASEDGDQRPANRHPLSIEQVENNRTTDSPSTSSSSASYHDPSTNDLTLFTGAILLTADCMGTGILALPADIQSLGRGWGIGFLIFNLPINLYAGTILGRCALYVEERILGHASLRPMRQLECDGDNDNQDDSDVQNGVKKDMSMKNENKRRKKGYSSVDKNDSSLSMKNTSNAPVGAVVVGGITENGDGDNACQNPADEIEKRRYHRTGTATSDFVGMTSMLFDAPILPTMTETFVTQAFGPEKTTDEDESDEFPRHRQITYKHPFTKVVLSIYYMNLFLVLGNYILVMSHAVSAMAGENNLCIPTAGIIASTLMFGLSQLRTMANLGRSVSAVSLAALLIVVLQCLYALRGAEDGDDTSVNAIAIVEEELEERASHTAAEVALSKMSSLAAICFAVGSQKLLLNIRHEMADPARAAPGALSAALSTYGIAYVVVCLLAGPRPPSFLFDAIPAGWGRRIGGFLLWVHVAVSYAINSQAFCSSVDRVVGHRVKIFGLEEKHQVRWGILTALVALSSYFIANSIPFFKDLVALCGAATSIPLTLLIPAIFYRRVQGVPLFFPTLHSKYSFALILLSVVFILVGLTGAIGSIDVDWSNKSGPFACH